MNLSITASSSSYAVFGFGDPQSYTNERIHHTARTISSFDGFNRADIPDLEQELKTELWACIPSFDASRSAATTFTANVVDTRSQSILRREYAQKRDRRLARASLNGLVSDADGRPVERSATLASSDTALRVPSAARRDQDVLELQMDVRDAVSQLDPELLDIVNLLPTYSHADIRSRLGLSRRQFDERLRQVRQRFEDHGLSKYVF